MQLISLLSAVRPWIPLAAAGATVGRIYTLIRGEGGATRQVIAQKPLYVKVEAIAKPLFLTGLFCLSLYLHPFISFSLLPIGVLTAERVHEVDQHILQRVAAIWKRCSWVEVGAIGVLYSWIGMPAFWPLLATYSSLHLSSRWALNKINNQSRIRY